MQSIINEEIVKPHQVIDSGGIATLRATLRSSNLLPLFIVFPISRGNVLMSDSHKKLEETR